MGRFDALTQLDTKPVHSPPLPEVSNQLQEATRTEQKRKKPESLKARKEENLNGSNQESPISDNQAIPKARKPENRKVPKYSTQLEEALQLQVSVYAAMHGMKDYEVVQQAIEEYLNHHQRA